MKEASGSARHPVRAVRPGRWFVSAPVGVDLRPLLEELRQRGLEPYVLSDVALLGASIAQSVHEAIGQAEVVVVVLGEPEVSQNSLFEAGVAVGLAKPVLVIADPEQDTPSDLAGLFTIRARPSDLSAIRFALDQAEEHATWSAPAAVAVGRALGARSDQLLSELERQPRLTEHAAVGVLTAALEESGVVTVESPDRDAPLRFDLGVWADDLDAIAVNPLLIEVKQTLSAATVQQTRDMLLATTTGRAALLVFLEPAVPSAALLSEVRFPLLAISLRELLERMRTSSFAEVVRGLRNRAVHGTRLS